MTKRLTTTGVDNAKTPKADKYEYDAVVPGLALKLCASGRHVFIMKKIWPGSTSQSRRTLGPATGDGLAAARKRAERWNAWVAAGIDPATAEAEERQANAANPFRQVAEDYITFREGWAERNRRIKDDAREIRRDLISAWGPKPIAAITPADVRSTLAELRKRSAHTCRGAWNHASGIFKWAVHQGYLTASPLASLDKKQLLKGAKLGARAVILDAEEVGALWRNASRMPYPTGPYYRLLLLTACRKNELLQAEWSELHPKLRALLKDARANDRKIVWAEIEDEIKVLTIPAERYKSDAVHLVPLSNAACAILEAMPRWKGCDFLFSHNGKTAPDEHKGKTRLDARMLRSLQALARMRGDDPSKTKLTEWTNHDLRRVVKSGLAALKIPDHVSELVLGHARKGLQGVYDRYSYLDERRQALEQWSDRISALVEPKGRGPATGQGANVVALRKGPRAA